MNVRHSLVAHLATGMMLSATAAAQQTAAAPSAVKGQLSSLLIGMLLILAVIVATAWLLKRIAPRTYGASSVLRVVGGVAVGQRERVVIVEVGAIWLVVGVAPGGVTTLHQMPRAVEAGDAAAPSPEHRPFAHWLNKFAEMRAEHRTDPRQ